MFKITVTASMMDALSDKIIHVNTIVEYPTIDVINSRDFIKISRIINNTWYSDGVVLLDIVNMYCNGDNIYKEESLDFSIFEDEIVNDRSDS